MTTLTDKVAKGAALLDNKVPGWRNRVNAEILDQSDGEKCVLGQLYGVYFRGIESLHIDIADAADYGFNATSGGVSWTKENRELTGIWKALLSTPAAPATVERWYDEATLLALLDAGVTVEEFQAHAKVSRVLNSLSK